MTLRALFIGLALGLLVSAFTFFNDAIIKQSWFISNHLPISVFGAIVVLLLGLNPLAARFGRGRSLDMAEVAVIAAIGLAACGWPSFSFYWGFVGNTATPAHWIRSEPSWQANHVMSYVPGASSELGDGHVRDWTPLVQAVVAAEGDAGDSIPAQVWRHLSAREQEELRAIAAERPIDRRHADRLVLMFNRVIREAALEPPATLDRAQWPDEVSAYLKQPVSSLSPAQRAQVNRWALVSAFSQQVLPPPPGDGALVAGRAGAADAVTGVMQGRSSADGSIFTAVPWTVWWPTLRLWCGLALLLGIASLCMAMIVHPQWSRRELLTYPLAQFVAQLSRGEDGRALPAVAYHGLFWMGLAGAATIHLVNGLHAWNPSLPQIPLQLRLNGLTELFPYASRVSGAWYLFSPYLYLSAIAFAFFLNTRVSFSVGIAAIAFAAVGGALLSAGVAVDQDYLGATPINLMRFGSYLGMTAMIVYVGRRYYGRLAGCVVGMSRPAEVPAYAVWAGRALVVCCAGSVVMLRSAGLDWVLGSLFVALVMLMFLILSRIVAETGLFFVQTWWMPVAVLTALFGIESIGPTSYVLLALASVIIVGDPRTALMPYLTNGLQMVERSGARASGRIGWPLLTMIVLGLFVAGLMTMGLLYDRGIAVLDNWSARSLPSLPFDRLALHLADMNARQTLVEATAHDGLTTLSSLWPTPDTMMWIGLGVGVILITALARLRLPWWPIHPVLFLVWGTMPASRLAVSFLIGWAIKLVVVRTGGARAYHKLMPLMIGVIAGELLIALFWIAVGAAYYADTNLSPPLYRIYP